MRHRSATNRNVRSIRLRNTHTPEAVKTDVQIATRLLSLTEGIIYMIGDLGRITVSSFWPHPYYHTFCDHRRRSFQTTLSRLQKRGLIAKAGDREKFFVLTSTGKKEYTRSVLRVSIHREKNKTWDGKWRILIFDIPEKHKAYREFLRAELREYGFMQLQRSVWITPFCVAEQFQKTIEEMGMDRWVKLLVGEVLFNDKELRQHFRC